MSKLDRTSIEHRIKLEHKSIKIIAGAKHVAHCVLGAVLKAFWRRLGISWVAFGAKTGLEALLGSSRDGLGGSFAGPGVEKNVAGNLWGGLLGPSWGLFGASWAHFGSHIPLRGKGGEALGGHFSMFFGTSRARG